jgi:hypothetical protein
MTDPIELRPKTKIVISRTIFKAPNSRGAHRGVEEALPFQFSMKSKLFPQMKSFPVSLDSSLALAGMRQAYSRYIQLNASEGIFQTILDITGNVPRSREEFVARYDDLKRIVGDQHSAIYGGLKRIVGDDALYAWSYSFDLITEDLSLVSSEIAQGLTGPFGATASSRYAADEIGVRTGSTGSVCYLPASESLEIENAIFWLGFTHFAFAKQHSIIEHLVSKQTEYFNMRRIDPLQLRHFINLKIDVLNTVSRLEPQVLGSRWVDFAVYEKIHSEWSLASMKGVILELLDRIESIVQSLEDVRIRKNGYWLSMLINIITVTGLFSVLSYLVDFSGRQRQSLAQMGVSSDDFVTAEPLGVLVIAIIMLASIALGSRLGR